MIFNIPDLLFSLILIYFTINGLFKGFIKEISDLSGLFISCYIASEYHEKLNLIIHKYDVISDESNSQIIAFITIFLITLIIIRIISLLIQKFFEFVYLGWLNRILGSLLGFIKGFTIISIIIFCLGMLPEKMTEKLHADSTIYQIGNNIKKYMLKNAVKIQNEINEKGLREALQNQSLELQRALEDNSNLNSENQVP